jgi:hypothetical protein
MENFGWAVPTPDIYSERSDPKFSTLNSQFSTNIEDVSYAHAKIRINFTERR